MEMGEVPDGWSKTSIGLQKKAKMVIQRATSPVSLTLVPGKWWTEFSWSTSLAYEGKDDQKQHGFTKSNQTACYNEMTGFVDGERAVDVIYVGFKLKGRAVVMGATQRSWRKGLTGTSWNSIGTTAKTYIGEWRALVSETGWGWTDQRAALQERSWESCQAAGSTLCMNLVMRTADSTLGCTDRSTAWSREWDYAP